MIVTPTTTATRPISVTRKTVRLGMRIRSGDSAPEVSRSRRAIATRNTAPTRLVTTPVGTATALSEGTRARSSTSEPRTSAAPTSPATGSVVRARAKPRSLRASGRTRAGAHRPTKPMGPASVTAVADSSEARTTTVMRVARTGTPRPRAASSPRASASTRRAVSSSPTIPIRAMGSIWRTPSKPFWLMLPWFHW